MINMESNYRERSVYVVRPAEPTWHGCLSLSEFDQIDMTYTQLIYFYKPVIMTRFGQRPHYAEVADTLRDSLSKILVPFYPLAGRLRWIDDHKGRLELDCNGNGVEFIQVESSAELVDLGDYFTPSPNYQHLFPDIDFNVPIYKRPVLLVQLTIFKCGGVGLGIAISHVVADGLSTAHFLNEWARVARGEPLGLAPIHDRNIFIPKTPPLRFHDHHSIKGFTNLPNHPIYQAEPTIKEMKTIVVTLRLAPYQVKKLIKLANIEDTTTNTRAKYTLYEAVSAHIWRTACKARMNKDEEATTFTVTVDSRRRLSPPLPSGYFGNTIFDVIVTSKAGDLVSNPLGYGASRIRAVINKVTNEYVWSTIDLLKNQQDMTQVRSLYLYSSPEVFNGKNSFELVTWLSIPFHGIDFGWGKEIYFGPAHLDRDGEAIMLHSSDGDGSLLLVLCVLEEHVDAFKKYFYEDIITSSL